MQPQDLAIAPRILTKHVAHLEDVARMPLNHEKLLTSSYSSSSSTAAVAMAGGEDGNGEKVLYFTDDHPQNRRGFRYTFCRAHPDLFPALQYTSAELPPFKGTLSLFDRSPSTALSVPDRLTVSTPKGFVSARADLCMREGHWYYECRVDRANDGSGAHVRMGVSRREAALEAPVGFDAYGYGVRDVGGQAVHLSRVKRFMEEPVVTGDVIGFHVYLPPEGDAEEQAQQQQQDKKSGEESEQQKGLWRDRIAIRYKGLLYFEHLEYTPTKEMEELIVPLPEDVSKPSSTSTSSTKKKPPLVIPKLNGSFIRVYKNGIYKGQPFTDLNSFAPPNSKLARSGTTATSTTTSSDDGLLGYFPTVSVFRGGTATFNFGPKFDYVPEDVKPYLRYARCSGYAATDGTFSPGQSEGAIDESEVIRPLCERYEEQIAEDIVQDIVDEVDFELQDMMEEA